MPTYDYVCDACEHRFEHRQSMSSNRLRTCPKCKQRKLRRLIGSGAGVIFKGSGFYETDYKRAKSKGGGKGKGKGKDDAKTESKPAETSSSADSKPAATSTSGTGTGGKAKKEGG